MKTFFSSPFMAIVITASFLLSGFKGTSQIQHGGTPISLQAGFPEEPHKDQADPITLTPYHQSLRGEILAGKTPAGQPMRAGFGLQVNYHPLENGTWLKVGDSLWVWRLHIEVEKAHGLGLILEEFTLEEGARIFVLNEKTGEYTGAYTHLNNNTHQLLSVQALPGEKITIEYQEKVRAGKEKFSGSSFRITELVYLVNGLMDSSSKNLGNSEACMINVNCSEGNEWQSQKRGVARILLKNGDSWFWCSGSLLNTTRQDGTPYFLTADHCGGGASDQDMRLWQFYFNFERPGCDNSGQPVNNVLYGCSLLVNSPLDGGSDFKLLMLHQHPPLAWQPYYNGWNILDIPSESGVGIHHPAGDAKKISTYQGAVYSGSASFSNGEEMADDAAWRFAYVATENGHSVTQGGSSGSAMFNQDGLIVGTLSGGSSSCDNPTGINVYGKMSYHWDLGDERILQVKDYLDPNQTGIHALQGYDPHTEAHPAPGFVSATLLQDEDKVRIDWLKPGHTPNKEGWYQHTTQFTGARKDVPERVTVFDADALGFSWPITLTHISHIFNEVPEDPWQNDQFTFHIYDQTGLNLLYSSDTLTATSLTDAEHALDTTLVMEEKFYVSVRSLDPSGHPSSAYDLTNLGNSLSYAGSPGSWQTVGNSSNQFVFLTSIYIDDEVQYPDSATAIPKKPVQTDFKRPAYQQEHNTITDNKWANQVLRYKLFKNNEHIHTLANEPGIQLTYTDSLISDEAHFIKYHLVARYRGFESKPSASTYVFFDEYCQDVVTEFPFTESFEEPQLEDCWFLTGVSDNGWQISDQWSHDDEELLPEEGDQFIMVQQDDESEQDEWLISPILDLTQLEVPALKFLFAGNFPFNNEETPSQLNVYISFADNSFIKIWDSSESPSFQPGTSNEWIPVTIDLRHFADEVPVRVGFQYTHEAGAFIALDNIEWLDASDLRFDLSIVQLPELSGEVHGAGTYLAGEKVTVSAYANTPWFFQSWTAEDEIISWRYQYSFVMPEQDYLLVANFTEDNVMSVDEADEQDGITLYPNPTQGSLSVKTSQHHQNLLVEIYNTAGILVQRITRAQLQSGEILQLDMSGEAPGLYILVLHSDQGREVTRFSLSE